MNIRQRLTPVGTAWLPLQKPLPSWFPRPPILQVTTWAMIAFLVIFPTLLYASQVSTESTLPAAAQVGDVAIGRMSPASARTAVKKRIETLTAQPISLTIADRQWTPLPADLGIIYDVNATLEGLAAVTGNAGDSQETFVPIRIMFVSETFNAFLDSVLRDLGAATDAKVVIDGLNVSVVPAKSGLAIDRAAVQTEVLAQVESLQPVTLVVDAHIADATITTAEAERVSKKAKDALAEPYVLSLGEESWSLAPESFAPALRVIPAGDHTLQLSWDVSALDNAINKIAAEVETAPSDSWVQDLDTKSWLVPATEGRALDRTRLAVSLQQALTASDHHVALPIVATGTVETTTEAKMAELGITGVVGTGDSTFAGSPLGRDTNLRVAAHMIDGTLVAPGAIFSFNDAVGSLFNGMYVEAGSYIDGPQTQSLAGGVCQVSTTVFRAALNAGFPIVEWWPHRFRSPYYEMGGWSPGFDAAIVQDSGDPTGSSDFRFENTTGSWLMISAKVDANENLKVEIHGANPGYTVSFDDPVLEVIEPMPSDVTVITDDELSPNAVVDQPGMEGLQVTVVRYVHDANGELISQDSFVSTYGAYGTIRRVGPEAGAGGGE